jgi:organic radical activating enzyme
MQTELAGFVAGLANTQFEVDLFTNGTQEIPSIFTWYRTTVVMDWKLPGSGEVLHIVDAGWDDMRFRNARHLMKKDAIKYVVKDEEDFESALRTSDTLHKHDLNAQEYVGVVWGEMSEAHLVDLMMRYKVTWKLNVQMHNHIWPVNERRR